MLNHKKPSIMLGMLLLIVGSAAYAALPPRVSWTPAQLTPASMEPGTSMSHTVVLQHTGILPIPATNQLRIVVEGAIAPSVTITPPQFPPVFKRGNQVTVPITISVPANTPAGEEKGNLVLKRILPNGKENEVWRADMLPVTVTVTPTCILPQVLQNGVCIDITGPDIRLFINPMDSQVASIEENGVKVDYYGDKNSTGYLTSLRHTRVYSAESGKTADIFFNEDGSLNRAVVDDLTLKIERLSETTAQVSITLSDGNTYSAPVDLPAIQSATQVDSNATKLSALTNTGGTGDPSSQSLVHVTKCGNPVDEATVEMIVTDQSILGKSRTFSGSDTGKKGTYSVSIPTKPAELSVIKDGQVILCDALNSVKNLGACNLFNKSDGISRLILLENAAVSLCLRTGPLLFVECELAAHTALLALVTTCRLDRICDPLSTIVDIYDDFKSNDALKLVPVAYIPGTFPDVPGGWNQVPVLAPSQFASTQGPFPEFTVNSNNASTIPPGSYSGPASWQAPYNDPSRVDVVVNNYGIVQKIFFLGENIPPYIALPLTFEYQNAKTSTFQAYGLPTAPAKAQLSLSCNSQTFDLNPEGYGRSTFQIDFGLDGPDLNVNFSDFANSFEGTAQ
jgi:hypothetical protein